MMVAHLGIYAKHGGVKRTKERTTVHWDNTKEKRIRRSGRVSLMHGWLMMRQGRRGMRNRAETRSAESKILRERENNTLKQQPATTLIGHFVHLFDLFKLWDN